MDIQNSLCRSYRIAHLGFGDGRIRLSPKCHNYRKNYARYRQYNVIGQVFYHVENIAVPCLWCLSYLRADFRDLCIYIVKQSRQIVHYTIDKKGFYPFGEFIKNIIQRVFLLSVRVQKSPQRGLAGIPPFLSL